MKYAHPIRILQAAMLMGGTVLLSACFIEGGGCTGPVCFGVSTDVCGSGFFCNDLDEQAHRCPDTDDIEVESTAALNRIRGVSNSCALTGSASRNTISWNDRLFAAADAHSRDMASNNFTNALGSDGLGVIDRLGDLDIRYVSQSVAGGFSTVEALIDAWASDGRECPKINNEQAGRFALACRFDGDSQFGTYWTLVITGQ